MGVALSRKNRLNNPSAERASAEVIAEKDRRFPAIPRPCGTPGAVYTVTVSSNDLGCVVRLPFNIEVSLPPEAKEKMKTALHDALLPIVESFYRQVWAQTIAGKTLDGDTEPMPQRWGLLFAAWLKRCFERGEAPTIDGKRVWAPGGLPTEYRWWK